MNGKSIVLSILVLFLFSAAAIAGEEGEQENSKTTLRTLAVDFGEGVYNGGHFVLKEGACDGSRDGLNNLRDGADWAVHTTPAEYGRNIGRGFQWSGEELVKTPGRAWRATKWGLGHIW